MAYTRRWKADINISRSGDIRGPICALSKWNVWRLPGAPLSDANDFLGWTLPAETIQWIFLVDSWGAIYKHHRSFCDVSLTKHANFAYSLVEGLCQWLRDEIENMAAHALQWHNSIKSSLCYCTCKMVLELLLLLSQKACVLAPDISKFVLSSLEMHSPKDSTNAMTLSLFRNLYIFFVILQIESS